MLNFDSILNQQSTQNYIPIRVWLRDFDIIEDVIYKQLKKSGMWASLLGLSCLNPNNPTNNSWLQVANPFCQ